MFNGLEGLSAAIKAVSGCKTCEGGANIAPQMVTQVAYANKGGRPVSDDVRRDPSQEIKI